MNKTEEFQCNDPPSPHRLPLYILLLLSTSVVLMTRQKGPGLPKEFPWQFRLMARVRVVLMVYLVVPLSFGLWMWRTVREKIRGMLLEKDEGKVMAGHEDRVAEIVHRVKMWNLDGRRRKLRTARPNWASMSTKRSSNKGSAHKIKLSQLNHILKIDEEAMSITCEPAVNMGQITDRLVPLNLALEIQVEMESLTIGGVCLGFGMETNSYRSGLIQETIRSFHIITSEGVLLKVTKENDAELFHALPWSHGSLGILVAVEVAMIRIKQFVKVTYIPTYTLEDLQGKLISIGERTDEEIDAEGPFSLEATIYSPSEAVIQLADYCDYDPSDPAQRALYNPINRFWKPYYYKHVQTFITKGKHQKEPMQDIIPVKHFFHRFTRSIFWEIEGMIPFSNHPLYRILWGWMGAPEVSLLKLFQGPIIRKTSVQAHVVQESIMPIRKLTQGIQNFDHWFGVYPLLVFPIRIYDKGVPSFLTPKPQHLIPGRDYGLWVDLGAYGVPREIKNGRSWDAKSNLRGMEHWSRENGAWTVTYTDNFMTRKEFRQMFEHELYDKVRGRLKCQDAFPEVYDKVRSEPGIVDLTEEEAKGL